MLSLIFLIFTFKQYQPMFLQNTSCFKYSQSSWRQSAPLASSPLLYDLLKDPNSLSKLTRNKKGIDAYKKPKAEDKSLKKGHVKTFDCINIYRHRSRRKVGADPVWKKKCLSARLAFKETANLLLKVIYDLENNCSVTIIPDLTAITVLYCFLRTSDEDVSRVYSDSTMVQFMLLCVKWLNSMIS